MESEEEILARHRKEKKDLQAKIQSLKKSATKGDKKKRKEVLEEIAKLEIDTEKKHSDELNNINNSRNKEEFVEETAVPEVIEEEKSAQPRVTKAQKRRDKKLVQEKERAAEIAAQEELNKNGPRMLETQSITNILKSRNLSLHPIISDGNCLFNAVIHQLDLNDCGVLDISSFGTKLPTTSKIIRMRDILNEEEFGKYCEALRNTPAWGGQIEITALSNILKVQIEVIQATGPPTIQGADEFSDKPKLVITYHRHMYSLGEHYNSTKPLEAVEVE
uniref:OTU domain-containing protein n=1 Tax=Megaselia scalaris TaxID=36166 RepID=T1GLH2_MEGSC